MHIFIAVIITAPLAALVTSFIENKLNYNLYDLLKDKLVAAFKFVFSLR